MDIIENWDSIKSHFRRTFSSSLHFSIATVDDNNQPNVSPIGTVFLNKDQTGFYFEKFTTSLPSVSNKNVCILAVNSSKRFWVRSLFNGRFETYPGIKLYGQLGTRRKATVSEMRALKRRVRFTRRLKGHKILWNDMNTIREVNFTSCQKLKIGSMTKEL